VKQGRLVIVCSSQAALCVLVHISNDQGKFGQGESVLKPMETFSIAAIPRELLHIVPSAFSGGSGEIRTHDGFPHAGFQVLCILIKKQLHGVILSPQGSNYSYIESLIRQGLSFELRKRF